MVTFSNLVCETLILSRDLQTIMQLPQLQGVICTARVQPFQLRSLTVRPRGWLAGLWLVCEAQKSRREAVEWQ